MGKGEHRISEAAAEASRERSRGRNYPPCQLDSREEEQAESRFSAHQGVVVTKKVTQEEGSRFGDGDVVLGKQSRESLGDQPQGTQVVVPGDLDLELEESKRGWVFMRHGGPRDCG